MTHDPQRQFASPYNYGAWDPTNLTDHSGEFVEILIASAIFAVAAGVKAGVQTGDPMEGVKAFGINLGTGLISAPMGSVAGQMMSSVPATLRLAATLSLGSYGVVSSVRNGDYVSAAFTFGNMVYSAHGIATESGGRSGGDRASRREGSSGSGSGQAKANDEQFCMVGESQDEAGAAAVNRFNGESIARNREAGRYAFRSGSKCGYTGPVWSESDVEVDIAGALVHRSRIRVN